MVRCVKLYRRSKDSTAYADHIATLLQGNGVVATHAHGQHLHGNGWMRAAFIRFEQLIELVEFALGLCCILGKRGHAHEAYDADISQLSYFFILDDGL